LRAEAENADLVLCSLVHARELVPELLLGDVGAAGMEDVTVGEKRTSVKLLASHSPRHYPVHLANPCFLPKTDVVLPYLVATGKSAVAVACEMSRKGEVLVQEGARIKLTRPSACGPTEGCG
jgi:hypothetical protein